MDPFFHTEVQSQGTVSDRSVPLILVEYLLKSKLLT